MKHMIQPIIDRENRTRGGLLVLKILLALHLVALLWFSFDAYMSVV